MKRPILTVLVWAVVGMVAGYALGTLRGQPVTTKPWRSRTVGPSNLDPWAG